MGLAESREGETSQVVIELTTASEAQDMADTTPTDAPTDGDTTPTDAPDPAEAPIWNEQSSEEGAEKAEHKSGTKKPEDAAHPGDKLTPPRDKLNVSNGQGGGGVFSHVRSLAVLCLLIAAAYEANPGTSEEGLKSFLRARSGRPLAYRAAETFGYIKVHLWNLEFGAVGREESFVRGREGSHYFAGIFNQWVPLPALSPEDGPASIHEKAQANLEALLAWLQGHDVDALAVALIMAFVWGKFAGQSKTKQSILKLMFFYSIAPQAHAAMDRSHFFILIILGACFAVLGIAVMHQVIDMVVQLQRPSIIACLNASAPLCTLLAYMHATGRIQNSASWVGRETLTSHVLKQHIPNGTPWSWAEFALLQFVLGADTLVDVLAHIFGGLAGLMAVEGGLFDVQHIDKLLQERYAICTHALSWEDCLFH